MKELKLISVVNFVRSGKSSISRLLAEYLNTAILNFDPKRDSEFYNAVPTTNIPENQTIEKKEDYLLIGGKYKISTNSDFFICDFGGRFDDRIGEFKSDLYIIPTMYDFESISETLRATSYILKKNPSAKIIHILNMAMCFDRQDKEEFLQGYKTLLENEKGFPKIPFLEMPRSKLVRKIINQGVKKDEIIGGNKFLELGSYAKINNFITDLVLLIKKELEIEK